MLFKPRRPDLKRHHSSQTTQQNHPQSACISRENTQSSLVTEALFLQGYHSKAGMAIDTGVAHWKKERWVEDNRCPFHYSPLVHLD